jgi:hypothetical protein
MFFLYSAPFQNEHNWYCHKPLAFFFLHKLCKRTNPILFHKILHSLKSSISFTNELRQAGGVSQSFILYLPERIVPTSDKNTTKAWHVTIRYFDDHIFRRKCIWLCIPY